MASSFFSLIFFSLFLQFHLISSKAAVGGAELVFEDGYTVSTVLNGDKSNIKVNPQSVLHQSPPSDLFIILDSVASTFYTSSLPINSNETVIKRLAGTGMSGYVDGDLASAKFNKPKSFAVDLNGNVYVADPHNHAIRKITKSGVSTIAGGYSQKSGNADGPALDATFSDDFELTFSPETCALMISDRGNRLVRQIILKAEDCVRHSNSGVLGTTSVWLLISGFSCLISLALGFVIRPFVLPYEVVKPRQSSWTWKRCLMSLERQVVMLCSDSTSAVVKSSVYVHSRQIILLILSHLSLMFRRTPFEHCTSKNPLSLMDLDLVGSSSLSSAVISAHVSDQLKDLITFDKGLMTRGNCNEIVEQEEERESRDGEEKIDGMIQANLANFVGEAPDCSLGVVRRR